MLRIDYLSRLPDELLIIIFKHTPIFLRGSLKVVSKRFNKLYELIRVKNIQHTSYIINPFSATFGYMIKEIRQSELIQSLELQSTYTLTDSHISMLSDISNKVIDSLYLDKFMSNANLLSLFKHIKSLYISEYVELDDIEQINQLTNLTILGTDNQFILENLNRINIPTLTSLQVYDNMINYIPKTITSLCTNSYISKEIGKQLTKLDLYINDVSVYSIIKNCTNIKILSIHKTILTNRINVPKFEDNNKIISLTIHGIDSLECLESLPNLEELILPNTHLLFYKHVEVLNNLKYLTCITPIYEVSKLVSKLSKLRVLNVLYEGKLVFNDDIISTYTNHPSLIDINIRVKDKDNDEVFLCSPIL